MELIGLQTYGGNEDLDLKADFFRKIMAIVGTNFNQFQYQYCISHGLR
jgi:hypothetical protein